MSKKVTKVFRNNDILDADELNEMVSAINQNANELDSATIRMNGEIVNLIKGTSENSSALEYPRLYKSYQKSEYDDPISAATAHIDSIGSTTNGVQESKNVGVTVLNVNGNCWRLHTFVQSYASQVYVQKIEGALIWNNGKFLSSSDYHEYTRKRNASGWSEWKENESASSDIVDLGAFARSAGGENKAATVEFAGNPDILMMKYTITGQGTAIIHQTVNDARSTQYLVLAGQWFTRYITFTDNSRTAISQVTAWWRTMPTNVEYNAGTRRVRLVDYNRQHSLPLNSANDGFELPLADDATDGLMSKEDKSKLDGITGGGGGVVDLGKFERSKGGEDLAATVEYAGNADILMMSYTITGAGKAIIHQTVNDARSTQYLVLAGQWFTRYITFTDSTRTAIAQVTAWHRTMPTNVEYNAETHRIRLIDYNRQHSLPENKATDGFELPLATQATDGLMSKEDKAKLDGVQASGHLRPLYLAAGAKYNASTGRYELNGLTDITEAQMEKIYAMTSGVRNNRDKTTIYQGADYGRTNFPPVGNSAFYGRYNASYIVDYNSTIEVLALSSSDKNEANITNLTSKNVTKLTRIIGKVNVTDSLSLDCQVLTDVKINGLKINAKLICPKLSFDSIKYLVDNAANTSQITVTLHHDVYRLLANAWSETDSPTDAEYSATGHTRQEWDDLMSDALDRDLIFTE